MKFKCKLDKVSIIVVTGYHERDCWIRPFTHLCLRQHHEIKHDVNCIKFIFIVNSKDRKMFIVMWRDCTVLY